LQSALFLADDQHRVEFVRRNVGERDCYARSLCRPQVQRAPQQVPDLRCLEGVQPVEPAVVATAAVFGRIQAELRIA